MLRSMSDVAPLMLPCSSDVKRFRCTLRWVRSGIMPTMSLGNAPARRLESATICRSLVNVVRVSGRPCVKRLCETTSRFRDFWGGVWGVGWGEMG